MTSAELTGWATAASALVAAIGSLVSVATAVVAAMRSAKNGAQLAKVENKLTTVENKQDQQHLATNSRLDELLRARSAAAHEIGKAEGLAAGRAEAKS